MKIYLLLENAFFHVTHRIVAPLPLDASQASSSSQWLFEALTRVRDARPNAQKSRDFNKRHSQRRRRIEPNRIEQSKRRYTARVSDDQICQIRTRIGKR